MSTENAPTFEELLDWVENRLPSQTVQRVEQQVATADASLTNEVKWLQAFGKLRKQIKLQQPPQAVRTALMERFVQARHVRKEPGFFRRLWAVLNFDSALQPAASGVRTGESGHTRQLIYAADVVDIALNIQSNRPDQQVDIMGQILANDQAFAPGDFSIQLLQAGNEVDLTLADDGGEFLFTDLKPGRYQFVLSTEQFDVQLPELEIPRE